MANQRPDLGFTDELDSFDPQAWKPSKAPSREINKEQIQQVADATGFKSREKGSEKPARKQRRRRTGRNAQINIKTRPDIIEKFYDIADKKGLGLGEAFELAVALLEKK